MKIKEGCLIALAKAGEYDLIMQGCNCMNQMGKGIALSIKKAWPEAYAADCLTTKGDASKLGTYSEATLDNNGKPLIILNCYTQYLYNSKDEQAILADYEAIAACMKKIKMAYGNQGLKMGMPLIGAGLAKGDWNIIAPIIDEALAGEDLTLIKLPQ
jgi:O-acetyl-ADP-ribose deacetylase (regulator of RNase III)